MAKPITKVRAIASGIREAVEELDVVDDVWQAIDVDAKSGKASFTIQEDESYYKVTVELIDEPEGGDVVSPEAVEG